MMYKIGENKEVKFLESEELNYIFNKTNGHMKIWGKTKEDDPQYSPFGPFILDIEISKDGCPDNCSYCYKSNTNSTPINMTLETFKIIIDKVVKSKTLTQVALGITGVQTNPDLIPIMKYCREIGIIPNFTLTGSDLTDKLAKECSELAGAMAVSIKQHNKDLGYNTIKKLTDLHPNQINIHALASKESRDFLYEIINDIKHDDRLLKLNALVLLCVKGKGRARGKFTSLNQKEFTDFVIHAFNHKVTFGFDSCSAPKFEMAINSINLLEEDKRELIESSERCESFGLFSSYINVWGTYFPCSFCEGEEGWEKGLDVLNCNGFIKDIWFNKKLNKYRKKSMCNNRECLIFPEINN